MKDFRPITEELSPS